MAAGLGRSVPTPGRDLAQRHAAVGTGAARGPNPLAHLPEDVSWQLRLDRIKERPQNQSFVDVSQADRTTTLLSSHFPRFRQLIGVWVVRRYYDRQG